MGYSDILRTVVTLPCWRHNSVTSQTYVRFQTFVWIGELYTRWNIQFVN